MTPPSPSEPDREAAIHAATSELIAQIEPAFEVIDPPATYRTTTATKGITA